MEDYAITINLAKLSLQLRNKYMIVIKKLNIRYLLENQLLSFSNKYLCDVADQIKSDIL